MFFSKKIKVEGKANPGNNGFVLIHSSKDIVKGTHSAVTKENIVNLDPADIHEEYQPHNYGHPFESKETSSCNIM